jgi:hypothetical protein
MYSAKPKSRATKTNPKRERGMNHEPIPSIFLVAQAASSQRVSATLASPQSFPVGSKKFGVVMGYFWQDHGFWPDL